MNDSTKKHFYVTYKRDIDEQEKDREWEIVFATDETEALNKFELDNSVKIWLGFIVDIRVSADLPDDIIPF